MTETGWYTGDQKPVRVGAYKRRFPFRNLVFYSWWDGRDWEVLAYTLKEVKLRTPVFSSYQNLPWRGLTEECK